MKEKLTEKELEVMEHIAQGFSDNEIAEKLVIAETTVKTHKIHIYQKYQVDGCTARVKAVIEYLKQERGIKMFETYEEENKGFEEVEIPYLELAKKTGANRCIHFNWDDNINETCFPTNDFTLKKCLLLDGKSCSECVISNH